MSPYHTRGIKRAWQKSSGQWESRSGCPQGGDRTAALRQRLEGSMERCWPFGKGILFSTSCWFHSVFSVRTFLAVCWRELQFLGFICQKALLWVHKNLWERRISRKCFDAIQRWIIRKEQRSHINPENQTHAEARRKEQALWNVFLSSSPPL